MLSTLKNMTSDHDRYLLAAFLPDGERLALEREAEGDETALEMVRVSHELRDFIGEAEALRVDAGSEAALAFLAAARLASGRDDPEWSGLLDRLERRLDERIGAREAYRSLAARIRELEAASDAEAHFRRISGSDPPRIHRLRPLVAAAAVLAAVALTGVLGRVLEDPVALAAHRSLLRSSRAGFRGAPTGDATPYARAAAGRRVVFGLWPTYDRKLLSGIERDLTEPDSAAGWLLAGQLRLMLGDHDGARTALRQARDGGLDREASILLDLIADPP